MYREESERLYDQFQKFQELLRQKQKIINDLMQQQATMHETIMDASSSMRAMSNQSPLDRYAGFSQPPPPPPPLASSSRILDEVYDEFEERLLIGKEENEMLRKKLKSVIAQLQGVMRERNQLMDLSNSLKAEIETRQQIISTNNNENVLLNSSADNSKGRN